MLYYIVWVYREKKHKTIIFIVLIQQWYKKNVCSLTGNDRGSSWAVWVHYMWCCAVHLPSCVCLATDAQAVQPTMSGAAETQALHGRRASCEAWLRQPDVHRVPFPGFPEPKRDVVRGPATGTKTWCWEPHALLILHGLGHNAQTASDPAECHTLSQTGWLPTFPLPGGCPCAVAWQPLLLVYCTPVATVTWENHLRGSEPASCAGLWCSLASISPRPNWILPIICSCSWLWQSRLWACVDGWLLPKWPWTWDHHHLPSYADHSASCVWWCLPVHIPRFPRYLSLTPVYVFLRSHHSGDHRMTVIYGCSEKVSQRLRFRAWFREEAGHKDTGSGCDENDLFPPRSV